MIRPSTSALLMLWLLPTMAWSANSIVHVIVKSRATVSGKYFTLGDVAKVRSTGADTQMALSRTRLGLVPPIGYPMTVSRQRIQRRLASDAVAGQYHFAFSGSGSVLVRCRARRVSLQHIVALARGKLLKYLTALVPNATSIEVEPSDEPTTLNLPAAHVTNVFRLGASPQLAARMPVWVDFAVNGSRYQTRVFWFNVSVTKRVLEAARHLDPREALASTDLQVVDKDIAGLLGSPLPVGANISSLRTTRAISAGQVVLAASVEPKPMVEPLEPVSVTVTIGSVRIQTQGVAEGEGRTGDLIRVRNPSSQQTYLARVIGPGDVTVSSR